MSSQHPYGASPYRPFSPALHLAPRPSSPSSGSAPSTGSALSSSHTAPPGPTASTSTSTSSQMAPPSIWRTSAFSPQHSKNLGQTRMRARSIGKGSQPPPVQPHLSPTIPGSPGGGSAGFDTSGGRARGGHHGRDDGAAGYGPSPLARQRSDHAGRVAFSGRDLYDVDGEPTSHEGTEESGSTRSDSPPPRTPRDAYPSEPGTAGAGGDVGPDGVPQYWVESPSRRNSDVDHHEREAWRTGGEPDDHEALALAKAQHDASRRNRSQSLEGVTRMSLRRGRSFTSLVSPVAERKDPLAASVVLPPPIFEQYEPPPTPQVPSSSSGATSLYDSAAAAVAAGDRASTSLYPPATGGVPLVGGGAGDILSTTSPKSLRDFVPQLVILLSLFVSSFAVIAFTISTLPGLFLPHSVADLPALTATLTTYRASSYTAELHLFAVLTLLFLWKQCFSIPGSVLTNILFGALYGTSLGTWWACLWTALGSTGAYAIALVIAPLVRPCPPPLPPSLARARR